MHNNSIQQLSGFGSLAGLPCYQLNANGATVVVSAYGAQVLSYQNAAGRELLWLSQKAKWQNNNAIRGGVPICWPWFGKAAAEFGPEAAILPNHGLVRTAFWQMTQQHISAEAVSISFIIELAKLPWSHKTAKDNKPVRLIYQVTLSDVLELQLSCDSLMMQQAALHSYFQVAQAEGAVVSPLPLKCYDKVSNSTLQLNEAQLHFQGEIDRVYPDTARTLTLSLANSTTPQLTIAQHGHDASVLWNPGHPKAGAMADMHLGAAGEFVCIESARLALEAKPLSLTQIIRG
ncbi:D-hexose-6-phosphate mutarotase [Rheinheimera sp.]|uniref:aldose epimerase family protein n=1 Tax=Rheinheimera sp. TaxID=1869214 RepID=UPI0027B9E0FB|nr:D-hexose-6-phosphate mutarotase [Rheinheimera sp.]